MTKNTDKPSTMQLFSDERTPPPPPLPLVVAAQYDFPLQHHQLPDGIVYSITDWVSGLTGQDDPKKAYQMWDVFNHQTRTSDTSLNETSISNRTLKLPYLARDGKTYKREFVTDETLYRFAAYARATADRPQIKQIKDFLAKAGAFADKIRRTPAPTPKPLPKHEQALLDAKLAQGYSEDDAKTFIQLVREGKVERRQWTDILKMVVRGTINYGQLTNVEYRSIFKMTAKEISALTGFKVARDGMTPTARSIITSAEIALEAAFNLHRELTFDQALRITEKICKAYGSSVAQLEDVMGVSLITGKPLLEAGR